MSVLHSFHVVFGSNPFNPASRKRGERTNRGFVSTEDSPLGAADGGKGENNDGRQLYTRKQEGGRICIMPLMALCSYLHFGGLAILEGVDVGGSLFNCFVVCCGDLDNLES